MKRILLSTVGLVAVLALFLAVNILAVGVRGARVDLTENRLYTLAAGSKRIAQHLDEPITLTLYYSEKQANDLPAQYKSYGTRVREVLREFTIASKGKIRLNVISPEAFSDEEDKAVAAGLVGVPTGRASERFYFGLVAVNSTDQQQVIPFFDPSKEEFLEYDLTRAIYLLSNPAKKAIGLMSSLPIEGVQDSPFARGGQTPPWQIVAQMKELFEVKKVAPDVTEIPADVRVLMVVHPKNLGEKTLYAIDQFVLRGGRLMVFVDPWCEADVPPGVNPMQTMGMPRNSDLKRLMDAWGIEMVAERVAADKKNAIRVQMGSQTRPETVDYIAWMQMGKDSLDSSDAITGQLQTMNVATAGVLTRKPDAAVAWTPLIQTSTESGLVDVKEIQFVPDPKKLLAEFVPSNQRQVIAARLSGKVKTAFADGDPSKPAPTDGTPKDLAGHLAESAEPINVIVVADCDLLHDRFWVQEERLGQILLGYRKLADNGDFVIQALDNLSGSSDLISVRARGRFSRPFERVQRIQKDAEAKYIAKEQELQTKLRAGEARISDLMRQKPDGSGVLLTPEVQEELSKARKDMVATRKELRDVQHQMRKSIESLGTSVKFVNIGLMPAVIGAAAVGLSVYRVNRRRTSRATPKDLN
ncbi:MAG: Gldg family protein [Phycisphaerae bacterium]|nr:Gldg family protein [Phycisphaerae bacterium]